MKNRVLSLAAAGVFLAGSAGKASAEVNLSDAFSVSGFVSGSYLLDVPRPGLSTDHFDLDNALLSFKAVSGPVSGLASIYHEPNTPQETTLLDAAVAYDAGGGLTVTGGRFQSILGYEAYHAVDNPNIAYANNELITIAPGYHSGLKVEFGRDSWTAGAAVLDSIYSGTNYLKGDGELKDNRGYEGFVSFKGVKNLVVTLGAGHEGASATSPQVSLADLWITYQVDTATLVAADYAEKDGGTGDKGHNWIALLKHDFSEKFSAAFRASGESVDGGGKFTRYTFTPAYRVTSQLTIRAEYSWTDYRNNPVDRDATFGVQAFLKF